MKRRKEREMRQDKAVERCREGGGSVRNAEKEEGRGNSRQKEE